MCPPGLRHKFAIVRDVDSTVYIIVGCVLVSIQLSCDIRKHLQLPTDFNMSYTLSPPTKHLLGLGIEYAENTLVSLLQAHRDEIVSGTPFFLLFSHNIKSSFQLLSSPQCLCCMDGLIPLILSLSLKRASR